MWWSVGALNLWGDPSRGAEKRAVDGRWAAVYLLFELVTNSSRSLACQATAQGTMRRTVAVLETFRAGWRALVASASEP